MLLILENAFTHFTQVTHHLILHASSDDSHRMIIEFLSYDTRVYFLRYSQSMEYRNLRKLFLYPNKITRQ